MNRYVFILVALFLFAVSAFAETDFSKIDAKIDSAPVEAATSISSLADYISKNSSSQSEKARAIFYWITKNISYDTIGFAAGEYPDPSAEVAFKTKQGVCAGYSNLFKALSNECGLESEVIIGFTRGSGYAIGSKLEDDPDHAWNCVKIDDKWYLLDATWAAGYVKGGNKFVRELNDFYYLTPSNQFIYDHFPKDEKWQLLDKPITKQEYQNLVYLRPGFFRNNLSILSNKDGIINGSGSFSLKLGSPKDVIVDAKVSKGLMESDSASTLVQRSGGDLELFTAITKPGEYVLRVFAKKKQSAGSMEWAADYMVKIPSGMKPGIHFPKLQSTFHDIDARLIEPMQGSLKSGDKVSFKIDAPGTDGVAVVINGNFNWLVKNGDSYQGDISIDGNQVLVAARFANQESCYVLLKYQVS